MAAWLAVRLCGRLLSGVVVFGGFGVFRFVGGQAGSKVGGRSATARFNDAVAQHQVIPVEHG